MRQAANTHSSPQSECQVCRAAKALVVVSDILRTAQLIGRQTEAQVIAVERAARVWEHARNERHTGIQHEPVVIA